MLVSQTWIKLIDFGMAKRLFVDDVGFSLSTSTIVGTVRRFLSFEISIDLVDMFLCAQVPFMAPEVRNFQSYNCKADIFSIGALIYEMATGDPFVRIFNEYITETMCENFLFKFNNQNNY